MAKYASLRKVRLDKGGYIMKGQPDAGQYRGSSEGMQGQRYLYRLDYSDHVDTGLGWQEFRTDNRAHAVIQARQHLARYAPHCDVRS